MKVGKKQNPSIFWALCRNLLIEVWRFEKKIPSKSGEFGAFFSMRNPLDRLKSYSERNKVVVALLTFHK
jgi:hypothetical protein